VKWECEEREGHQLSLSHLRQAQASPLRCIVSVYRPILYLSLSLLLRLLCSPQFEVFASFENVLMRLSTLRAFEFENDLLCCLHFLVEDGLRLTSEAALLSVVASLTLCSGGGFAGLLLPCDGVRLMGGAALTVSVLLLRIIHHCEAAVEGERRRRRKS